MNSPSSWICLFDCYEEKKKFKHEGMHHCAGYCFVYRKVKKKKEKKQLLLS